MSPHIAELASLCGRAVTKRWRFDWQPFEADLGFIFPDEYKEYVSHFPPGVHGGVITPVHPGLTQGGLSLPAQVRLLADLYRGWENRPQPPMPTYPDAGGLIPWADNEGHAALCWLPDSDDPNTWPVFATREENTYERIPGGAVEALIAVLRGDAGRSVFEAPFYENLDLFGAFTFDGDEGPSGDVDLPTPEPLDQPAG